MSALAPWCVVAALAVITVVVLVQAQTPLPVNTGFLPGFLVAVVVSDAMTGLVLLALYVTGDSPRFLALSWAYVWTSAIVTLHALVFPDVFTPAGFAGSTPDSAPWLWVAWHVGFAVLLVPGLLPWPARVTRALGGRHRVRAALVSHGVVLVLVLLVGLATTVGAARVLPPILEDGSYARLTTVYGPCILGVQAVALVAAFVSVLSAHRAGVERWALVALAGSAADAFVVLIAQGRWTVGWYGARIMALTASFVVLVALGAEAIRAARRVRAYAERLVERNAALKEVQEERDHVVAVISHDLRSPLSGVIGYLELLDSGELGRLEPDAHRAVRAARDLVTRITLLADDLGTATASGAGRLPVTTAPLDLADEVYAAVAGFPDLEVRVDTRAQPTVTADPLRVQQVLANLLGNAAKYGDAPVRVLVDADAGEALVSVSDAGPGVPDSFVPLLFDRYSRAPGVQAPGTGLGLSVVHDIVEAHHGTVAYVPERNAFEVRLPLATGWSLG
ncbi:sensor histidine kinase [Nocardioides bruguierae]|uniref:sensor histidine kinase n=1 Tax=Nocardioides bruguierae TaxID=2945102 RepID=UPI0020215B1F|nr:MASE4 domain-containing protein [Nocardioides bruguierae]MCL8027611.1 MASE4 domain-containing protein [Nocardioides bruguierae]